MKGMEGTSILSGSVEKSCSKVEVMEGEKGGFHFVFDLLFRIVFNYKEKALV